jgi:oligoendopeptidase F
LVEELFVSAAVSAFEDSVYELVEQGGATVANLDAAWLAVHRSLWGGVVDVPDLIASGWARLPALAVQPGHAFSYVWATVLALAIDARHPGDAGGVIAAAIRAGGIEADELTAVLGFDGDEWIDVGLAALADLLDRLGQFVRSGTSGVRTG